jgi:hypothetical protein
MKRRMLLFVAAVVAAVLLPTTASLATTPGVQSTQNQQGTHGNVLNQGQEGGQR